MNQIKKLPEKIGSLRQVKRSADRNDDLTSDLPEAGKADYLGMGDKSALLSPDRHKGMQTTSATGFAALFV